MTTIYLMRHGETDWNRAERMQGQMDCPLNAGGRRQAAEVGRRFARAGVTFDRVYSSTLWRAMETAAIVSGKDRSNVIPEPNIIEMGFGPYEGVRFTDLPPEMFVFFADPEHVPAPEGMETIPNMRRRIEAFLDRLRREDPGGTVLAVCHGVTMRVLLGALMRDYMAGWNMPLGNCCVYRTVLDGGEYSIPESALPGENTGDTAVRAWLVERAVAELRTDRRPVIVAIDGRCGSGKTTLATALSVSRGWPVVHMDDFFPQSFQRTPERLATPGGNVDHERFAAEVLEPLRSGHDAFVRRYDCRTCQIGEATAVPPSPVVIVEGSYACHPALWDGYDLRVFLDVDPMEQMRRIKARNGAERAQEFKNRWIPLEELYFSREKPALRCELYLQ